MKNGRAKREKGIIHQQSLGERMHSFVKSSQKLKSGTITITIHKN